MSTLRSFYQTPVERKRYSVSYKRWLDPGEVIFDHTITISPLTDPAMIAEESFATEGATAITFYLKGGVVGQVYDVRLIATTTQGQIKQDDLQLAVVSA